MKRLKIVCFIGSLILMIGSQTVFRACGPAEDGTWMNCHNAQMYVFYLSIALTALALAGIFVKNRMASAVIYSASAVLAVIVMLIPGVIVHMCMMETMRCHMLLKPFALIMGILTLVFALISLAAVIRRKK